MRLRTKRRLLLVLCLVGASVLLAPATAAADPGSALDQYIEAVPGADGDHPNHDLGGQNGNGQAGQPLPPAAEHSLQQLGQAGRETAALAIETGPSGPAGGANEEGDGPEAGGSSNGNVDAGGDKGPLAVAVRLVDPAPDGLGFVLPLIVVGTLIAAVAFALRRQMRKPDAVS
jgi:hypothetical protein